MKNSALESHKQAKLYAMFARDLYPDTLATVVAKRVRAFSGAGMTLEEANVLVGRVRALSKKVPRAGVAVLRTIVNGWSTSHRLHTSDQRPCVFGCSEAVDSLHHYFVVCPRLDFMLRKCTASPAPSRDPRAALGFGLAVAEAEHALLQMAVSSRAYAAICASGSERAKLLALVRRRARPLLARLWGLAITSAAHDLGGSRLARTWTPSIAS